MNNVTTLIIPEVSKALHSWNNVFQAEAIAISEAAKILMKKEITNKELKFYCDSQGVLRSLEKRVIKNDVINICNNNLNNLAQQNKIEIHWIPAHKQYEGNERADTLAKKGAQKLTEEETYSKTPHKNLETKIYKYFKLSNLNCYQNSTISCEAKILTDEILKFYKFNTEKLSRSITVLNTKQIRTLIMTLSNHNPLNYHLEK